jgi:hypothetical protein
MYTPLHDSDKHPLTDSPNTLLIEQTLGDSVSMISPQVSCLFRLLCVFVDEGGGIDKLAGAAAECDWKSPGKSLTFRQQRFNIPRGHAIVLCG